MRISGNVSNEALNTNSPTNPIVKVDKQGSEKLQTTKSLIVENRQPLEMNEETTAKLKEAVSKMNEMLQVTNSSSKFLYHEGLNRYYVTVVDRETEEIVKEIPPRKLLDAYYEMQKMLGMVVDEKI